MHDDLLERRLRASLRSEADRLPLTITAAELERRAALRRRHSAVRRSTLLLAATVGIASLGVGGIIASLADNPTESPGPTFTAIDSDPGSTEPTNLGTLDEFIRTAIGGDVVLAQAHDHVDVGGDDPDGALPELASMSLGTIDGSARYQLTVACLGDGAVQLDIRLPASRGPRAGPTVDCDGAHFTQPIDAIGARAISLTAPRLAAWRVVVRRLDGDDVLGPNTAPPDLAVPFGSEALLQAGPQAVLPDAPAWRDSGLLVERLGSVPTRWEYDTQVWCTGGDAVRLVLGFDFEGGRFEPTTETLIPCDNRVHDAGIGLAHPAGSDVAVVAAPGTTWVALVSGERPPIATAEAVSGWQVSVTFGPHLQLDPAPQTFSGPGVDGGGPVLVVFTCAGTGPIEVTVETGGRFGDRTESLVADCRPEGAVTSQSFEILSATVSVTYAAPVGTWTAISFLVPDPLSDGG